MGIFCDNGYMPMKGDEKSLMFFKLLSRGLPEHLYLD